MYNLQIRFEKYIFQIYEIKNAFIPSQNIDIKENKILFEY